MLSKELKFRASVGNIDQNKVVRKQRHVYCRGINRREWTVTQRCITVWNSNKLQDNFKVIFSKLRSSCHTLQQWHPCCICFDFKGHFGKYACSSIIARSQPRRLLCLYSKDEFTTSSQLTTCTRKTGDRGNSWPVCHVIASLQPSQPL